MSDVRLSDVKLLHTASYENKSAALKFADATLYLASAALGYEDLTLKKDSVKDKNGPVFEAVKKVNNCAVRFFLALAAIVTLPIALIGLAIKACFMSKQTKEIQTIANGTLASTSTLSLTHSASKTQTLPGETQEGKEKSATIAASVTTPEKNTQKQNPDTKQSTTAPSQADELQQQIEELQAKKKAQEEKTRKENDKSALELLKEISATKDESAVAHRDKFLSKLTDMSTKDFGDKRMKESISQALAKLNKDADEEIAAAKRKQAERNAAVHDLVQKPINEYYTKANDLWTKTPEGKRNAQLGQVELKAALANIEVDKKMFADWSAQQGRGFSAALTEEQFIQRLSLYPAFSGHILFLLSSDLQKTYQQRIAGIVKTKDLNDPKDDAAVRSFFEWMDHSVFNNPSIVTQPKEEIIKRFEELVAKKDASRLLVSQWRFVNPADLSTPTEILNGMRDNIDKPIFGEFVQKRKKIKCGSVSTM